MSRRARFLCLTLLLASVFWAGASRPARAQGNADPIAVEPADLERRRDLIGREIQIDDRVAFYVERQGRTPDEIRLKRTRVELRVPRDLRPRETGRPFAVVARGVLRGEGSGVFVEVKAISVMPPDLDRLERGISELGPRDYETRRRWADWAIARGRDFKDEALLRRGRAIEGEALRIEADLAHRSVDAPARWLALARDGQRRGAPRVETNALAHKAIRARLASARSLEELKAVLRLIDEFLPAAATDRDSARYDLKRWLDAYENNPEDSYRTAPTAAQRAFDRRLWADATERARELEPLPDLAHALDTRAELQSTLPERPQLAERIVDRVVAHARENLAELRLTDLRKLASLLRESLNKGDEAREILATWLRIRRERLSKTDAEGALNLALLHEELADDRANALELLRQAWAADPKLPELEQAFRTRGYHKVKNEWQLMAPQAGSETQARASGDEGGSQGLRGLTADEVKRRLGGNPDQIHFIGTKGRMIEQWQYLDTKHIRFVNLLHSSGELRPRVVSDYTLPRSSIRTPGNVR